MTAHKIPLADGQYPSFLPSPTLHSLDPNSKCKALEPVGKFHSTPPINTAGYGRETPPVVNILPPYILKDTGHRSNRDQLVSVVFHIDGQRVQTSVIVPQFLLKVNC